MNPIRAVIDTQIWIFTYLNEFHDDDASKQPYRAILEALEAGKFVPAFSPETLDELKYMLTSSQSVSRKFRVDRTLAEYFVDAISSTSVGAVLVEIGEPPAVSSDPDDDEFIETAIVAHAQYLVSEDKHLHEGPVYEYLNARGIRVLYPNQFRKLF